MSDKRQQTRSTLMVWGRNAPIGLAIWFSIALTGAVLIVTLLPAELARQYAVYQQNVADAMPGGFLAQAHELIGIVFDLVRITVFYGAGVIIFRARSRDVMAALTSIMLMTFGVFSTTFLKAESQVVASLSVTLPVVATLLKILTVIGHISFVWFLFYLPDGSVWPRWTILFAILWSPLVILYYLFPDLPFSPAQWGKDYWTWILLGGYLSPLPFHDLRIWKQYSPRQKQQIKVIRYGLVMALILGFGVANLLPLVAPTLGDTPDGQALYGFVRELCVAAGLIAVPVSIALSILRYRLWDIDFVINRSLVYGVLGLLLAGVFIGLVVGARFAIQAVVGGTVAPILGAVLGGIAVALIYRPALRWLRRLVDRQLYGIGLDYQQALKAYASLENIALQAGGQVTQFGPYTNMRLVGHGGMGEVYQALDSRSQQTVAVKVLPPLLAQDPDAHRRFLREAQTLSKLEHEHIIRVRDYGEIDGRPYMSMDFLSGTTLSDLIKSQGALPLANAIQIFRQIANAIDYAHTQGIVHRDIKPSNVMIDTQSARATLMDFGIAKSDTDSTVAPDAYTGLMGTLDYIAPEQIQASGSVDRRADIYSMGVMAFHVLSGHLPFRYANPGALVMAHLMQPPPSLIALGTNVPPEADYALLRALAKKPAERFASAGEFVTAMGG